MEVDPEDEALDGGGQEPNKPLLDPSLTSPLPGPLSTMTMPLVLMEQLMDL